MIDCSSSREYELDEVDVGFVLRVVAAAAVHPVQTDVPLGVGRDHRSHVHEHLFAFTVHGARSDLHTV